MEKVAVVFTVFFEEPFWCGVYQRQEGRNLEAARMVFGAEPKEYEVLAFLLQNWKQLRFGSTDSAPCAVERKIQSGCREKSESRRREKALAQRRSRHWLPCGRNRKQNAKPEIKQKNWRRQSEGFACGRQSV